MQDKVPLRRTGLRRYTQLLLPLALLPLLLEISPLQPVTAAETFDVAALMRQMATVAERRDGFQEEKRLAALSYPLRSRGQLIYRRPAHLEKITTSPEPERLVIDGDQLSISSGAESAQTIALTDHPELAALVDSLRRTLAGDLPALQRSFAVDSAGTTAAWHLRLTPRAPAVAQLISSITIDGGGTGFRRVDFVQANGDEQILTIEPSA